MLKNLTVYKLAGWAAGADMEAAARAAQFQPCGPTQPASAGFVPPRGPHEAFIENAVCCVQIETKKVPPAEILKWVDARAAAIERETGRKPGRKQRSELKDEALLELLPKAFPKATRVPVWIDHAAGRVVVGSASTGATEVVATLLAGNLGVTLEAVRSLRTPAFLMGHWLAHAADPVGRFSVAAECELQAPDSKETIRYSNARLDRPEIQAHLEAGKSVRSLGLEYNGRVSFVLHEDGTLRKVSFDVPPESSGEEDAFDADVTLATGELRPLLGDLFAALGVAS